MPLINRTMRAGQGHEEMLFVGIAKSLGTLPMNVGQEQILDKLAVVQARLLVIRETKNPFSC